MIFSKFAKNSESVVHYNYLKNKRKKSKKIAKHIAAKSRNHNRRVIKNNG